MLTPLIDVMFLLLIFFMLSSQVSPYSLLQLGRMAPQPPDGAHQAASSAASALALRVSGGFVGIGGEAVPLADLRPTLSSFMIRGFTGFVVIATQSASVQDVVATLEALEAEGAERVTLVNSGGRAP